MTREMRRRAAFAGLFVFGALLLGAQSALAAPTPPTEATAEARPPGPPTGPTDLAPPTGVDPPTTTTTTQPPPPADTTTSTTTRKPVKPPKPVKAAKPAAPPPATTTTTPPPTTEPTSIPTPNRIDTGGGSSVPGPPTVLFWVIPGLAVLTLAAGVSGYWLARSEQDRR